MKNPLFFQRRFFPLWLGQCFGAIADNMNRQILLVGVQFGVISLSGFEKNDNAGPLIGALFPISMLIGSMYGGQFAEKFETSFMLRRTKILEFILMLVAGIGLTFGFHWLLVLTLFGMGIQSSSFNPTRQSAMPKYLEPNELIKGNGFVNAGLYACILLGYAIGGYLIIQTPDGPKFAAFNLIIFSLLGTIAVWFCPKAAATNPDLKINWYGIPPALQMVRFTLKEESVLRPIIGIALFYFISTHVTVVLLSYTSNVLGANGVVFTIITLLFAVGAGIGSIIAALASRGRSGLRLATLGVFLASLTSFGVYIVSQFYGQSPEATALLGPKAFFSNPISFILCGLFCVTSIFLGMYLTPLQAAIQRRAPDERRARILAVNNMVVAIMALLGSLSVLGITHTAFTPDQSFIFVSALLLCISIYMFARRGKVPQGLFDEMLAAPNKTPSP